MSIELIFNVIFYIIGIIAILITSNRKNKEYKTSSKIYKDHSELSNVYAQYNSKYQKNDMNEKSDAVGIVNGTEKYSSVLSKKDKKFFISILVCLIMVPFAIFIFFRPKMYYSWEDFEKYTGSSSLWYKGHESQVKISHTDAILFEDTVASFVLDEDFFSECFEDFLEDRENGAEDKRNILIYKTVGESEAMKRSDISTTTSSFFPVGKIRSDEVIDDSILDYVIVSCVSDYSGHSYAMAINEKDRRVVIYSSRAVK